MTDRIVRRFGDLLEARISRRSFLVRAAVAGSAASIAPLEDLLRPTSALALVSPGQCSTSSTCRSDGYTEFCCTVLGVNDCPDYTFYGGYWKCNSYTGSAYCVSADVRYYIDCNVYPGHDCTARCGNEDCNCRAACHINYQYGNCNSDPAHYDPKNPTKIVCRKVLCHNPAQDTSHCSATNVIVENATCGHAPCTHWL
jgi:hypothetical protein